VQIDLDTSLTPSTPRGPDRSTFLNKLSSEEYVEIANSATPKWPRKVLKEKDIRRIDLPDGDDVVLHKSYYEYAAACYNTHHGMVVAPHLLWYIVLCEISGHIKANADHYRSLFTNAPEGKTEITVYGDVLSVEMEQFITQLREHVPVSPDLFLPEFSTATPQYNAAASCAFMDAVSPYYSYSMMLCGIPKIRLEGTREDWVSFKAFLDSLQGRLDLAKTPLERIGGHIQSILDTYDNDPDLEFWGNIFQNERCGSGGQVKFTGWLTEFIFEPSNFLQLCNFPSCVSTVTIKQLETQVDYMFCHGLFTSQLDGDNWLVPRFGFVVEDLGVQADASAEAATTQPSL